MPIPREKLEAAKRPLPERILEFLQKDPKSAFDVLEILFGVEGYEKDVAFAVLTTALADREFERRLLGPYEEALDELQKKGVVEKGIVQNRPYFAFAGKA